jgi:hypothetical protein
MTGYKYRLLIRISSNNFHTATGTIAIYLEPGPAVRGLRVSFLILEGWTRQHRAR